MHQGSELFEAAAPGVLPAAYLARVVAVADPLGLARVQVRLLAFDGVGDQDGPVWARVAAPFSGGKRGAFFIPDVDDEVLVVFVNGDSRFPVVVGGLWNGADKPPETLGGDRVDRWTIVGKAGTRIAIVEESASSATIKFSTPNHVTGELTDRGGGKVEFVALGSKVTIEAMGVTIDTPSVLTVKAGLIDMKAGMISFHTGMAIFDGIVLCQTLITTTVVSANYTPGVGNVW